VIFEHQLLLAKYESKAEIMVIEGAHESQ